MSQKVVVGVVFVSAMFMSITDANAVCFNIKSLDGSPGSHTQHDPLGA